MLIGTEQVEVDPQTAHQTAHAAKSDRLRLARLDVAFVGSITIAS